MAINFLANQTIDNTIKFVGGGENYATLKMVSQGLEVSVGDPANTTNPLVHFDGAYERVLIGSTTAANTPYLRIGGAGNQSSRLELTETTTGVGKDMNYGFSFNQTGNVSNTLEIKRHSNSTAGSTVMTLARDNNNVVFTGLVSGITPTSAANFVTKAYADGLTPGSGIYLPINNPTFTGTLTGPTANFTSTVTVDNMLTININDISTGENRGLRLINEAGTDQQWNITAGTTGITNDDFCIRDSTNNVNAFRLSEVTGNATFAGQVTATEYNLPSGGVLDWANGDARIIEGLVNNYSLSFQTWDGTNLNTALRLDGNNNATFTGNVLATNVYVDTKIIHNGDANTYIQFADTNDKIILATNGSDALTIDASQAATFTGNVIVQGTSAAGYVKLSGDGNGAIYTSNGDMQFFTNNAAYTTKFYSANKGSTLLTILDNGNSTFAGDVGLGGTGLYTALHSLNIDGTGLAIKNDANGSNNNWSSIKNTATASTSNFVFTTGAGISLTLNHNKSATFSSNVNIDNDLTVSGGDITLGGTGRIQGIDTVSASTDAANKAYVDANSSSLSGSGAGGRVTIWSGTNILSSDAQLLFDTSTNKLTSTLFQIPNNGDYLGTDTGGSARTLISLTSGNDVEVSNSALTTGSDTIIYFGDNFRVKDGSTNRLSISSNGTMSNFGNTFNSGPINLDEGSKIVFDVDGDNWNYIYANSGNTDMAVGGTLTLINIEENLFGDIKLENIYSIINGSTSSNATFIPVYTDSASSTVPRLLREQTPAQFLSNAGAITGAGASGRVAFFTGTRTQASDDLYWNSTQNALGINVNPTSGTAGHLQMPGTTNSGGKSIFINTTLSSTYGALGIDVKTPRYGSAIQLTSNQTSGSTVMKILRYTGTQVGSIVANNGSTSFNTSSDRRLKEKITKTLDGAGEVLDQLRPCRFTFVDPKDPFAFGPNVAGFIADELQEVVPDAVSGLAGEVDNNRESPNFGQPIYQQVDATKLIPYLTQAIKDLQARVTSIEKRLPREPGPREFKEL